MIYRKIATLKIVDGPNKMDMLMSQAYAYGESCLEPMRVKCDDGEERLVIFTGSQHEDSSGHSFNVQGRISVAPVSRLSLAHVKGIRYANDLSETFEGYYNTQVRKGTLEVTCFVADDKPSTAANL